MRIKSAERKIRIIDSKIIGGKMPEKMNDLVIELRKGNSEVVDKIIIQHIPIVRKSVLNRYYRNIHSSLFDDITGVAFLGIVESVHDAFNGALYNDEITPYIITKVRGKINHYLDKVPLVPIPRALAKKLIKNNVLLPEVWGLDNIEDTKTIDKSSIKIFEKIDMTEEAWNILKLKSEGKSIREIGRGLNKRHEYVRRILNNIKERYERREKCM